MNTNEQDVVQHPTDSENAECSTDDVITDYIRFIALSTPGTSVEGVLDHQLSSPSRQRMPKMSPKALILIADGTEEMEL